MLSCAILELLAGPAYATAAPQARAAFPDSIVSVPATESPGTPKRPKIVRTTLQAAERSAPMAFEVALRMRSFPELQARIVRGALVPRAEMEARYFPLAADHDRVVQWLKSQGLEVTRTDNNHLGIFGRGSVDAVAQAFQLTFARISANGGEYTSSVTAPSLPADIAPTVLGIHGLQPHIRPHRLGLPRVLKPNAGSSNLPSYLPAQIARAYNANDLTQTGAGQTIALYELGFPQTSDLASFWSLAGVSQTTNNVQMVPVAGGPASSPSSGNVEEATLDSEWSGALAPGATVRIYGANENDPAENDEIFQQVYADLPSQPGLHQLVVCIGSVEAEIEHDYLIIEAQYMANLTSAGVTVLSASGDDGAYYQGVAQVTTPTSDPDVTGVGGTTLNLTSSGAVASETAWPQSSGGVSVVFSRPPWQTGTGVPSGSMRLVPDVASAADPDTGAVIVYSGNQESIGGTSWAAPTWAAWCALINQARAAASMQPLGALNPKIYPLMGTSAFRDITQGGNSSYQAGVGYDLLTGIGVPDVSALLASTLSSSSAPAVVAQLGNRTTVSGQPATFFVVVYGKAAISYQWQRMPAGSSTWSNLSDDETYSGTTTPMLVVTGTTAAMTGNQFQCIASNPLGSATSSPAAILTVNPVGVTTMAGWPGSGGSTNGTGWAARFSSPGSVRTDSSDNVYVADSSNYTIRRVTRAEVVTTVVGTPGVSGSTDGPASVALLGGPGGVAPDASGDVFIADSGNYTIRELSAAGMVSTLAGLAQSSGQVDGTGSAARFTDPENLALDSAGNIYVADGKGNTIRKVTPAGVVTTLAGSGSAGSADGTGTAAIFNDPVGIAVDGAGNVYVADYGNSTIRKITSSGVVTTIAGTAGQTGSVGGTGAAARFYNPSGVAVDGAGNLYVADSNNDTIREVTPAGVVTTVAGAAGEEENIDGLPPNARFDTPGDIAIDGSGVLYLADTLNCTVRRIVPGVYSAPGIAIQPASQTVAPGASVEFSVVATGTAPLSYQWYLNGAAISGATDGSYSITSVQTADAGSYTVTISNSAGSTTSSAAVLTLVLPPGSPSFTSQPQGGYLQFGGSVTLSAAAIGAGSIAYQWQLNGAAIPGATVATYLATAPGIYTVLAINSLASVVSDEAVLTAASRLINVSSRAFVGTGASVVIPGIVIDGPAGTQKQVLVRGIGPALASFGVTGMLAQPTISVFDSIGAVIASNTGWGTGSDPSEIATVSAQVGAFALPPGSADSALITSLSPGNYTVELSGVGGTTGVGLAEVYEMNTADSNLMANISTRADVGVGGNILIAGFVVQGTQTANVLIRADGPALTEFNVTGVLAQPVLTVYNSSGAVVATNTGWGTNANAEQIASAAAEVGAFALANGSADSALLLTLPPGSYTAQVSGVGGGTGVALVEVYELK